jgi:hypothetical protein
MNLKTKIERENPARTWRKKLLRRRRDHDPLLVFNMLIFNGGSSWQEIFSPLKARENVG